MQLTTPPEMTTAVTDFLLGCLSIFFIYKFRKSEYKDPVKMKIWLWIFGLMAFAAFYGTIAHAVVMDKATLDAFWMPLSFILGMMVSVFVIGVMYDWKGEGVLKKSASIMITLGVVFFIAMFIMSKMISGYFIIFIAYSSLTMLFSLAVYIYLAVKQGGTAMWMTASGVALIIIASAVQSMRSIFFTIIWEFDYNSVYHFIMACSMILFYFAVKKSAINS